MDALDSEHVLSTMIETAAALRSPAGTAPAASAEHHRQEQDGRLAATVARTLEAARQLEQWAERIAARAIA
eukprot:3465011-Lingulodinium_polyedra.AAC.1